MKSILLYSLILLTLIGLSPIPVEGAVAPVSTYVSSYHAGLGPARISVDSSGRLYITDPKGHRVLILSNSGRILSTIDNLGTPLGIAVDSSGRIYVGDDRENNVKVFDMEGNLLYKLGSGDGEVLMPNDIAISSITGNIYVTDSQQNKVKVYYPDGSFAFSFGDTGSANGRFGGLTGIAIDDIAGEVIVSDWNNGYSNYARIQIFDLNGTYKASFYTYNKQGFRKLQGLAIDKQGRIYLTDAYQGTVQVFDRGGVSLAFIGNFGTLPGNLNLPMDVAIDPDNKLFITSNGTGRVEVYGLDTFNAINLNPESMTFTGEQGGPNPPSQTLNITNSGNGTLDWTATTDKPWLIINPSSGQAPSQAEVSISLSGLSAGSYSGIITLTTATGVIGTLSVELTVTPPPVILDVSPSSLSFTAQLNGKAPSSQFINITNAGGGLMNWSASADKGWMLLNPTSGSGNSIVSVTVDTASLNVGTYTGRITVSSPNAQGSPKVVDVSLSVISAGNIYVTTNLSTAKFTITGPATYTGSGMSYMVENAPSGEYTIKYEEVPGYKKPKSEKKTLISGGSITFTGDYIDLALLASKRVIVTGQGPDPKNTALVRIWGRDGSYISEFMASELPYGVNVSAGDVNGDGIDDIITGSGPDPKNNYPLLRVFGRDGSLVTELYPFAGYKYGLNVAGGDIDGDGKAEIVVGAGPGPNNPARVKVLSFDSQTKNLVDTGIDFYAYSYSYGVKVAVGDIDGDGKAEIITSPGSAPKNPALIKIWKVDTSGGIGNWKASLSGTLTPFSGSGYSANISMGDVDGDDVAEIIVGAGPNPEGQSRIKILKADGTVFSEFIVDETTYGVNVASADLDGDGLAEIITGSGPGPWNRATVRVFKATGEPTGIAFDAYSTMYGVNVSVGKMLE